ELMVGIDVAGVVDQEPVVGIARKEPARQFRFARSFWAKARQIGAFVWTKSKIGNGVRHASHVLEAVEVSGFYWARTWNGAAILIRQKIWRTRRWRRWCRRHFCAVFERCRSRRRR